MDKRRVEDHWVFKKEIGIGHLLTTITAIGTLIIWGVSVEVRFAAQQTTLQYNKEATANILQYLRSMDKQLTDATAELQYMRGILERNRQRDE